jgi:predicted phosphodiesterase
MKYFVVSDVHSFCSELKHSLRKAGFNKRNKEHTLIVCGDIFDRGDETVEVYKYLKSIPKKRCILIRGNHESLYKELLTKSFPSRHDFSNGTVRAFCNIADINEDRLSKYYWIEQGFITGFDYDQIEEKLYSTWNQIKTIVANHEITKWLDSKRWRNYFELDKYIFVHSFIPLKVKDEWKETHPYKLSSFGYEYNPDWRKATDDEWEEATWGDPIDNFSLDLFKPEADKEKVLVVGHWHTSDFYKRLENVITDTQEIYYSKNLIAIDGGVNYSSWSGYSHPQNVLVIDSADFNKCYDRNLNLLEFIND